MMYKKTKLAVISITILFLLSVSSVCFVGEETSAEIPTTEKYYYKQLSAKEKNLYNEIEAEVDSFGEIVISNLYKENELNKTMSALVFENPSYYWLPQQTWTLKSSGPATYITLTLSCGEYTKTDIENNKIPLETKISSITFDSSLSRYDLIKAIHDYIVLNTVYEETGDPSHNMTGVLLDGKAVCEGYAETFKFFCDKYDIPCITVTGDAYSDSSSEAHAWNYVQMEDEKWYAVDVTWDDPLVNGSDSGKVYYSYFLVGSESQYKNKTFIQSHVPKKGLLEIPELSKYSYGQEFTVELISSDGTFDMDTSNIPSYLESLKPNGIGQIQASGIKFLIPYKNMQSLKDYCEANSISTLTFGVERSTKTFSEFGIREYEREIFVPYIKNGSTLIDLTEAFDQKPISIAIPYEKKLLDFDSTISLWSLDSENNSTKLNGVYSNGFVTAEIQSFEPFYAAYSDNHSFSFGEIALFAVVVILIVTLIIKLLLGSRGVSKQAKKLASDPVAMKKAKAALNEDLLSKRDEKIYFKAVRIAKKREKQ